MNVLNCRSCGRLFNQIANERICANCKKKLEDKFQEVKNYLRDNPNSTIKELAQANEISTKQIEQWIREERLVFADGSPGGIPCESCGKLIHSGKYCDQCRRDLANTLSDLMPKKEEVVRKPKNDGNRMRFLQ